MMTSVAKYLSALPGLNLGLTNGVSAPSSNGVHSEPSRLVQLTQAQIERYVTSSLPPLEQRARALCFADQPSLTTRLLRSTVGDDHVAYNYRGIETTVRHTALALSHYALQVGLETFLKEYQATKRSDHPSDRVLSSQDFFSSANRHYALWVQENARANGWNIFFEGVEKIPRDQPIVYLVEPHVAISPDFALPYVDENAAYVADIENFRNNAETKASGFSLLGDKKHQPLVYRGKPGEPKEQIDAINRILFEQILEAAEKFNLHAAWFAQGMRVPRSWDDDGNQVRAGLYTSIPEREKNIRTYVQSGYAINAVKLAERLRKPVKLVIVTIRGAEFAMPKVAKRAPFVQKNRTGVTIRYRIVDVLDVPVPESDSQARRMHLSLHQKAQDIAQKDLGINEHLCDVVSQWGKRRGYRETREKFKSRIADPKKGLDYLITANRIETIHPRFHERGDAARELLGFVHSKSEPSKEAMDELMTFVSNAELEHQYAVI